MSIEVRCDAARGRRYARALKADAQKLLEATGLADCELSLMLVEDRTMCTLNWRFRRENRPTDVLSFSQLEEASRPGGRGRLPGARHPETVCNQPGLLLGDVVISVDTARHQAEEMRLSLHDRLRTLLIHGFLHVLGYDHERSAAQARIMFERERELAAILAQGDAGGRRRRLGRVSPVGTNR